MPTPGNTTARGYGWQHRKRVRELWQRFRDGDVCRLCGQAMYRSQNLDAGHAPGAVPSRGDLPDELEHAHCNRSAGGRIGGVRRGVPEVFEYRHSREW